MSMLSTENLLRELAARQDMSSSFEEFIEDASSLLEVALNDGYESITSVNEAEYDKITKHLRLEILDVEKFVKVNDVKCVSNPRAFIRDGIPSDDGLLSNEIFGVGMEERAGTYGYIDLHGWFIDPSCYKAWIRLDKNIRNVVHGNGYYRVDERGQIVEDPAGKTGIKWLHSVMDKIKFEKRDSISKDISRQYLEQNRKNMWITKYIVIPPFYRDKNTSGGSSRVVGLGGVNKLYSDLIVASNALKETQDFLFDPSDTMNARVQEILLNIYDWFCGNTNANIKTDMGRGLSGKFGLIQGSALSKTSNFTSRLVISAPELKVETPEDMMVSFEKSSIPLSACMADFRDFIVYHTRRFFENEFQGKINYPVWNPSGEPDYVELPVLNAKPGQKYYMRFDGTSPESVYNRRLTWLDVFFIATTEAVKDKQVLITRFPIDSYTNQFTTGIVVSSTKTTEPVVIGNEFYRYYPKIREEDIGTDTSNKFVDTLRISNIYLPGIGGDQSTLVFNVVAYCSNTVMKTYLIAGSNYYANRATA